MLSHLSNAAYAEEPIREAPVFEKFEKACAPTPTATAATAATAPPPPPPPEGLAEETVAAEAEAETEDLIAQLDEVIEESEVPEVGSAMEESMEPVVWKLPKEIHDFFSKLTIKAEA